MKKILLRLQDEFSDDSAAFLKIHPEINTTVSSQLKSWEESLKTEVQGGFPFSEDERLCSQAEYELSSGKADVIHIEDDLKHFSSFLCSAKMPRDISFWERKIAHTRCEPDEALKEQEESQHTCMLQREKQSEPDVRSDLCTLRRLLQHEWRKRLSQKRAEWELETVSRYRVKYLQQLEEWLERLKDIVKYIEKLGLEPGYFLDFSEGKLSLSDIEQLKKWAEYLSGDQGVKDLCDLLGKLRQISRSEKIEMAKTVVSLPVFIPDVSSREEIIGIKLGKDIEHALPSELALLSDPETAILFDLKYVESRLMCFEMEGFQADIKDTEVEQEQQVSEEDKMGPVVICVDTSGSMHGHPETIAKAVTLYLTTMAKQQNRNCYLINFSTGIETLDLSEGYTLKKLLSFLQKSFYGGTDVAPAIQHGLGIMLKDDYQNADMLIISDFVMASLPDEMLEAVEHQRESGNRFYSLCIGNEFMSNRLKTHFDREWIYNPASSSIKELIGFGNGILGTGGL
ncbi:MULTISPECIES: VWA domain-containing protein [unclassified Endozoicomonas]|uniref:VWA domain-containing protein n=1 Tax=unclassified Endozoicomonas TaxID=2644528 RepID=UPI003BB70528